MTTSDLPTALPADPTAARRLRGTLGVPAIVFMVVAASAPLTVIVGVFPIGFAYGNGVGFPAMFVAVGVLLLLFAVGFTAMTRNVPRPGAFFTYIAHGLGRPWGLGAAYGAILCYLAIEIGVLGYIGYEAAASVKQYFGPDIHWILFTALAILAVGWLGFRHVELSAKVLAVLLSVEIAISLAICVVAVAKGGAQGLDAKSFAPSEMTSGSPALGLMFAAAAFIGFEATAIFRDEAKEPKHTIPRATFAAVILVGLFYAFTCWAFVVAWGPSHVAHRAATDPDFLYSTASAQLGSAGSVITHIFVITSIFAACLSFHNITTRYLHALAGAGVLPGYLSSLGRKDGGPSAASLTTSIVSAALVLLSLAFGLTPYADMFTWFVGLGSMMYLILLAGCALSVIVYFARHKDHEESTWSVAVAPTIAFIGLSVAVWVTAKNFPLLVGDVDAKGNPRFGGLSMALIALLVGVVAAGIVQAWVLRARRSVAYQGITEVDLGITEELAN